MKRTLLITALFGLFAVASCKKTSENNDPTVTGTTINDIKVPAGFNWESSRNVSFTVNITDTRFQNAIYKISIYTSDPAAGGTPQVVGSASLVSPFTAKLYLSNMITQVYIVKTAPDNSQITQKVTVGTASVTLSLGAMATTASVATKQVQDVPTTSPDCNGGCKVTITTSTSDIDMNSGDVLCVTGNNITIGLRNVNGGTLRVCGTGVTVNGNLGGNGLLLIATSGSVTYTGNLNSGSAAIDNFGTLNIPSNRADAGSFYNYGVCTIGADCNMSGSATFFNSGTLTINGGWQGGSSATATNNGSMVVNNNFQSNGTPFVNNCSLYVKNNYLQDHETVNNYGLIKVDATSTFNDNATLNLYGSMFVTKDVIVNGKIIGDAGSSTSLLKITGTVGFQNGGSVISNVQVYAVQGLSANYSNRLTAGAATGNSVYFPVTGCNSVGNGTPVVTDKDGDGVADNLDDYPNDPTKAHNITGATGTVAYEDQWPAKADFDLNDVVISYSYVLVTNAANAVVSVTGNYSLIATGGTLPNGFGVEFPVASSTASGLTVTKAGTTASASFESGQNTDKAVVILFTSMRDEMATWNTKPGDIFTPAKSYSLTFNVANGPQLSAFGLDEYNPFIYNYGRVREVHISGKTPTKLADATLFGTQDDNTSVSASRYYLTKTGLPYAINIPATFNYPTEGTDITKAYLHFADWAIAGGSSYIDWYSNTTAGYRVPANIFTH